MSFKYKRIPKREDVKFPSNRPKIAKEGEEILSGYVDGIPAKRDEEFFMQEVRKLPNVRSTEFRMTLGAPRHMPGWLELDALVETYSGYRAFEIDDMSFVHLGMREAAETRLKDIRRKEGLAKYGINIIKVEHIDAKKLDNRKITKETIQELRV